MKKINRYEFMLFIKQRYYDIIIIKYKIEKRSIRKGKINTKKFKQLKQRAGIICIFFKSKKEKVFVRLKDDKKLVEKLALQYLEKQAHYNYLQQKAVFRSFLRFLIRVEKNYIMEKVCYLTIQFLYIIKLIFFKFFFFYYQTMIDTQTLPASTRSILIILGQCTLPNGQPHPYLIDRVNTAYSILQGHKLEMESTQLIVSGSDVSNNEYGIWDKKLKHKSEAQLMYQLLLQKYQKQGGVNNLNIKDKQTFEFRSTIFRQDKARTTIENFYHSFKLIDSSKIKELSKIFVITSDFHMTRAKFCFQTMFFNPNKQSKRKQIVQNFDYKLNVEYIESQSKWTNQQQKIKKFEKELRLLNDGFLREQAFKTGRILWKKIS